MDYFNHGWGMGFGMWFIPILLVIIVIYLLKDKGKTSSAQDILDKRYANGDIDKKEYEEKSKHLGEHA